MDFLRRGLCLVVLFFIIGADHLILKAQEVQVAHSLQEQSINKVNGSIEIIAESIENFALALEENLEKADKQKKLHERRKLYFFLCKILLSGIAIGGIFYVLFNYLKFKFPDFNFRLPDFGFGLSNNSEDREEESDQEPEPEPESGGMSCSLQDASIVSSEEFNDSNVQEREVQSVPQMAALLVNAAPSAQGVPATMEEVTMSEDRATIFSDSPYSSTKVSMVCNWRRVQETREQIAYAREMGYLP